MSSPDDEPEYFSVLVTGANSGLGLAICQRLIDEFLHTRENPATLLLIPATRTQKKADATVTALRKHVSRFHRENARALRHLGQELAEEEVQARVVIEPALMDLCQLASVKRAAARLCRTLPGGRLDVLINNAGIGGWTGLNYPKFYKQMFTSPSTVFFAPQYKVGAVGWVTKAQGEKVVGVEKGQDPGDEEEQLGEVFCANVFGHYMLIHWLASALKKTGEDEGTSQPSRIIWVGSLEAYDHAYIPADGQALKSDIAYESSKRLTDLLVLTADDPANKSALSALYEADSQINSQPPSDQETQLPKMYLTHPGCFLSSIIAITPIQFVIQTLVFLLCRLLGSVWHTTYAYSAATSPVWLALASQAALDKQEKAEGRAKWGSAVSRSGSERCLRTEVPGWGFGGRVGEKGPRMGRYLGVVVTEEGVRGFRETGRECWGEMERLRGYWDGRLAGIRGE